MSLSRIMPSWNWGCGSGGGGHKGWEPRRCAPRSSASPHKGHPETPRYIYNTNRNEILRERTENGEGKGRVLKRLRLREGPLIVISEENLQFAES